MQLHSPAEVLKTGHTHLLVAGHRESERQTARGAFGSHRREAGPHVGRGEAVSGWLERAVPKDPTKLGGATEASEGHASSVPSFCSHFSDLTVLAPLRNPGFCPNLFWAPAPCTVAAKPPAMQPLDP